MSQIRYSPESNSMGGGTDGIARKRAVGCERELERQRLECRGQLGYEHEQLE